MTSAIASTANSVTSSPSNAAATDDSASSTPKAQTAAATNTAPTDVVDLSTPAQTIIQGTFGKGAASDLDATFKQLLAKRTTAFSKGLSEFLAKNFIPANEDITFHVDKNGTIHVDGAYKKKLEQYFKDNPDAAKELKNISALNTVVATQDALKLYNKEKKSAVTQKQQDAVSDIYAARSAKIQALSGLLTFKDGELKAAVTEYTAKLTD